MVEGRITRGTTGVNRLRRIDRWISTLPQIRRADALVADLGFGANATTTLELWQRLAAVNPAVQVVGVEIDPERVEVAERQLAQVRSGRSRFDAEASVSVLRGGFEVPLPQGRGADVVRAMNVLRQYEEGEVEAAWQRITSRLSAGGILIDGTCDELGRVATWIALDRDGPRSLTISLRLTELESPSIAAARLPKALIHHNVPGERVHDLLTALDRAWVTHVSLGSLSAVQRWIATARALKADGWPVLDGPRRWRLGEISVGWDAVSPAAAGSREPPRG